MTAVFDSLYHNGVSGEIEKDAIIAGAQPITSSRLVQPLDVADQPTAKAIKLSRNLCGDAGRQRSKIFLSLGRKLDFQRQRDQAAT